MTDKKKSGRVEVFKVARDIGDGNFVSITPEFWRKVPTKPIPCDVPEWSILTYRVGGTYRKHGPYFVFTRRGEYTTGVVHRELSMTFRDNRYVVLRCTTSRLLRCITIADLGVPLKAECAERPKWSQYPIDDTDYLKLQWKYGQMDKGVDVCMDITILEELK